MQQMTRALKRPTRVQKAADPRWNALGIVQAAMETLSLRDRDIAVLRGLLSFIPAERWDGPLVVFASNAALQARCDGIDERTLRRRLTRLSDVGLIRRNQSPNRKRYVVRDHKGEVLLTYGFDLAPLREALDKLRALGEELARTKRQVRALKSVLRDHLYQLSQQGFPPETDAEMIAEQYLLLRRKSSASEIAQAIRFVATLLDAENQTAKTNPDSVKMTDSGRQSDRDIQSSDKESLERKKGSRQITQNNIAETPVTLQICLEAAKTSVEFALIPPKDWRELTALAGQLAPGIGVAPEQWLRTINVLGERGASMTILGLVEAYPRIKEPKRYLNTLLDRAITMELNVERMFRSLTGWSRFPAGNR